ncbi:MAG: hypothetical protein C4337_07915 [Armatimonadota bacterium]
MYFFIRSLQAGFGFWLFHPLWLAGVWSVQGYPPTGRDFLRWYALGAFNSAPIIATGIAGGLWGIWLLWHGARCSPRRLRVGGALFMGLLVPPLAYALLLEYAHMTPYADPSVVLHTLLRAYLYLSGTAVLVGWLTGAPRTAQRLHRV